MVRFRMGCNVDNVDVETSVDRAVYKLCQLCCAPVVDTPDVGEVDAQVLELGVLGSGRDEACFKMRGINEPDHAVGTQYQRVVFNLVSCGLHEARGMRWTMRARPTPAMTPRSTLGANIRVAAKVPKTTSPCSREPRAIFSMAGTSMRRDRPRSARLPLGPRLGRDFQRLPTTGSPP